MEATPTEGATEMVPLGDETTTTYNSPSDSFVGNVLSVILFLISLLMGCVIPIIQLVIGLYYGDDCLIDERIRRYLIVVGSCGLANAGLIFLSLVMFNHYKPDSEKTKPVYVCMTCLFIVVISVLFIVMFIYFIFGCLWVFGTAHEVQFTDQSKITYCQPVLYKGAFATLILTAIWPILMCSSICMMFFYERRDN